MTPGLNRLLPLLARLHPTGFTPPSQPDVELRSLGFDSLLLVSLYVAIESELSIPLESLQTCLHRGCTLEQLARACA